MRHGARAAAAVGRDWPGASGDLDLEPSSRALSGTHNPRVVLLSCTLHAPHVLLASFSLYYVNQSQRSMGTASGEVPGKLRELG
jgi:hypothetical protein